MFEQAYTLLRVKEPRGITRARAIGEKSCARGRLRRGRRSGLAGEQSEGIVG